MSWIERAKVGDRIVCIDDTGVGSWMPPVVAGRVYVIAGVVPYPTGVAGIQLAEMAMDEGRRGGRLVYHPSRFRPVEDRPTDISVFTEMLKPVAQPVREDA